MSLVDSKLERLFCLSDFKTSVHSKAINILYITCDAENTKAFHLLTLICFYFYQTEFF
jgi:hypothetical protein